MKNHPNYREDTKFFVDGMQVSAPPREKGGKKEKIQMTDEQKKIHERVVSDSNHYSDNRIVRSQIDSFLRGKKIHPLTLDYLSDHDNEYLRRTIADHPNTSKKTLEKLSKDKIKEVREMVAQNPKTSSETLEKLSNDKDLLVVLAVYNNPRVPEKIRKKLSKRDFLQEIIDFK